jgi:hypothetical protein
MPSREVMHKGKTGELKSGGSGKPVPKTKKGQKQAEAIMFSERENEAEHGGEYVSGGERKNPLAGTRKRK